MHNVSVIVCKQCHYDTHEFIHNRIILLININGNHRSFHNLLNCIFLIDNLRFCLSDRIQISFVEDVNCSATRHGCVSIVKQLNTGDK